MLSGFTDLRAELDDLEATAEATSEFLKVLNGARTRLKNTLTKAEADINDAKNRGEKYFSKERDRIEKESLSVVKGFLKFNLLNAILSNDEFDEPPYRNALDLAIRKKDTYTFVRVGKGFEGTLKVRINLNKTAGRLQSWARGIKAFRKQLEDEKRTKRKEAAKKKGKKNIRKIEYNPIRASMAWAGIYARREGTFSTFHMTVRSRLELSGAVAPFWQIIDQGEPLSMSSNRGGFPTPTPQPTHFVHDTEKQANDYIDRQVIASRVEFLESFADVKKAVEEETARLSRLDAMAEQIRLDLKVVRNLEKQLGLEKSDINRTKLERQVQLIRQGVITTGRIEVSGKKGKRVRPTVASIRRYL